LIPWNPSFRETTLKMSSSISRRAFMAKTALIGAGVAMACFGWATSSSQTENNAQGPSRTHALATVTKRRKLGTLEVSSVGLGVQNMSRTYQTTIPTRPEMLNIIRTAYDHGVTFLRCG